MRVSQCESLPVKPQDSRKSLPNGQERVTSGSDGQSLDAKEAVRCIQREDEDFLTSRIRDGGEDGLNDVGRLVNPTR